MPTIEIVTVGRIKSDWIRDGVDHYARLLSRYRKVEFTSLNEAPASAQSSESIAIESGRIEKRLDSKHCNIVLDATGKLFDSKSLAEYLARQESEGIPLRFHLGGAYGLSRVVKQKADLLLSLSRLTLPHEMSLLVLLEQLYRSYSILAGSKYHK